MVRCTRLRWLATAAEACREMPVLAASDTMATSFSPLMNAAGQHTDPISTSAPAGKVQAQDSVEMVTHLAPQNERVLSRLLVIILQLHNKPRYLRHVGCFRICKHQR